jgi:hypothetical protein
MPTIVPDFYAKQGETFSPRGVLKGVDGTPQDLTLATAVQLSMRLKGGGEPIYDHVACTFVADDAGEFSYDSPEVIDPVAVPTGLYEMDLEAHFPGSPPIIHKFPDGGPDARDAFLYVKISPSAA